MKKGILTTALLIFGMMIFAQIPNDLDKETILVAMIPGMHKAKQKPLIKEIAKYPFTMEYVTTEEYEAKKGDAKYVLSVRTAKEWRNNFDKKTKVGGTQGYYYYWDVMVISTGEILESGIHGSSGFAGAMKQLVKMVKEQYEVK